MRFVLLRSIHALLHGCKSGQNRGEASTGGVSICRHDDDDDAEGPSATKADLRTVP